MVVLYIEYYTSLFMCAFKITPENEIKKNPYFQEVYYIKPYFIKIEEFSNNL